MAFANSDDGELQNALELQFGVNFVDLDSISTDEQTKVLIPVPILRKLNCVPIGMRRKRLLLAMVNPNDTGAFDSIKELAGTVVIPFVCTPDAFERYLDRIESGR